MSTWQKKSTPATSWERRVDLKYDKDNLGWGLDAWGMSQWGSPAWVKAVKDTAVWLKLR